MTGRPWFLGSCGWPGARVAVPSGGSGGSKRYDDEWEDTTPKPRGEIYRAAEEMMRRLAEAKEDANKKYWLPHERMATVEELDHFLAVQAPAGTGAAIVSEKENDSGTDR